MKSVCVWWERQDCRLAACFLSCRLLGTIERTATKGALWNRSAWDCQPRRTLAHNRCGNPVYPTEVSCAVLFGRRHPALSLSRAGEVGKNGRYLRKFDCLVVCCAPVAKTASDALDRTKSRGGGERRESWLSLISSSVAGCIR